MKTRLFCTSVEKKSTGVVAQLTVMSGGENQPLGPVWAAGVELQSHDPKFPVEYGDEFELELMPASKKDK